jgi:hypothetical protein
MPIARPCRSTLRLSKGGSRQVTRLKPTFKKIQPQAKRWGMFKLAWDCNRGVKKLILTTKLALVI